jgi:hypothetical protein
MLEQNLRFLGSQLFHTTFVCGAGVGDGAAARNNESNKL